MLRLLGKPARVLLTLLLLAPLVGCDDDPTAPTRERLAGDYRATTLTVTQGGSTLDALAAGVELEVTLRADGTTEGRFFVPAALNEPDEGDLVADLEGTWTLQGSTVRFEHDADTLVRDMEFTVRGRRLEAEETLGDDGTIRIVLTRQ